MLTQELPLKMINVLRLQQVFKGHNYADCEPSKNIKQDNIDHAYNVSVQAIKSDK